MKVSVIMPVYNSASRHGYIKEAIESFLTQDYVHKELVIVNDGSTDKTEKKISSYLKNNLIVYVKKLNGGQGSAENVGIKKCTGDLVTFLDDDDLLPAASLSSRVSAFADDIECVIGRYYEKYANSQREAPHPQSIEELKHLIWKIPGIAGSQTLMWRKTLHDKIGYINENVSSCEDYDWKIRVITETNIKLIDTFVYQHRYHPGMRSDRHRHSGLLARNKAIVLTALRNKYCKDK